MLSVSTGASRTRQQEHELANLHRHVVMVPFEAEAAGHSATTGVENTHIGAHVPHQRFFVLDRGDRFMMTVPVQQHALRDMPRLVTGYDLSEKLGQEKRLTRQSLRVRIFGKQVDQFVAKHCPIR